VKAVPIYATLKKGLLGAPIAIQEEEDTTASPVYENYDFQEEAIYQNMVVCSKGNGLVPATLKGHRRRSAPAKVVGSKKINSGTTTTNYNGDVYAQVKFLRMSVQEVNALIKTKEATTTAKVTNYNATGIPNLRSTDLVCKRTKELDKIVNYSSDDTNNSSFARTANSGSVKRSSNFRAILSRFNVMSQQENEPKVTTTKGYGAKRSLPNLKPSN
jgi:hypothetical protein